VPQEEVVLPVLVTLGCVELPAWVGGWSVGGVGGVEGGWVGWGGVGD
jgi:hypothetical protein